MKQNMIGLSDEMKTIGKLSSLITSYVRHCCRAGYDGTDEYTLDAFRAVAMSMLHIYQEQYEFASYHYRLFEQFPPADMLSLISATKSRKRPCLSCSNTGDLPKRICLHCVEVGRIMKKAREMIE